MKTYTYWVIIPETLSNPIAEVEKRLANTDMTWTERLGMFLIDVPVDSNDDDEVLEQSARKVYAAFSDIFNPELDELPYPRSAHSIIKYYDKQKRKPTNEQGYILNLGTGYFNIYFNLTVHSPEEDQEKAIEDCNAQVEEIVSGQDIVARLDIPISRGELKSAQKDVYFTHYTIGVRVKQNPNQIIMIEESALRLWDRVKDRKVHAEMDDMNGTLLEAIVKYFIPKRRKFNKQIGGS